MSGTVDRHVCEDVSEVLVRYATGIDRRDWALFRSCFTEDCEADYGDIGMWRGVDEITTWMDQTHAGMGHTMHRITNQAVSPLTDGRVAARSYVDALILGQDGGLLAHAAGFYDDELVETAEGWKISRRRYTMVRLEMGS